MHINKILKYCEDNGRKLSRQGLYQAGFRHGFISKKHGNPSYDFDEEKFLEWFNKGLDDAPEGWVRISELAKLYDLSLVFIYKKLLKDEELEYKRFGRGDGIIYVKLDGIERIIEKNRTKRNGKDEQSN